MRSWRRCWPGADPAVVKSRNTALAIALIALVILFYAVTVVRMRETEGRRHLNDPQAHSAPAESGGLKP
jgi:hypothetical protein